MFHFLLKFQNRKKAEVFRDVCQRWGYTIEVVDYPPFANDQEERDFYSKRCRYIISYRIFQNQTSDKASPIV